MAALGDGSAETKEIGERLGKDNKALGPVRAKLINKGLIYSLSTVKSGTPSRTLKNLSFAEANRSDIVSTSTDARRKEVLRAIVADYIASRGARWL